MPAHAAAVGRVVRLGKREVKHDARNLQLARYLEEPTVLPRVPDRAEWSKKVAAWPMYANDKLGDCTCAAVGHMEEAWSANIDKPEVPDEQAVLDLYWATGTEDVGRYCLDVLNYWQSTGFGGDRERVMAFVQIDPRNREHVELACWMFGGVYLGVGLPKSAQTQKDEWTVVDGPDAEPWSWGGHCVNLVDYTGERGPVCVTWGRLMTMTWEFFDKYCDEAYAIISPDWFNSELVSPVGFKFDELKKDLAAIKKAEAAPAPH
jgi:hypothetical protein